MTATNAPRKSFSYQMTVGKPPEEVFPLLCPVREYDWIELWDCKMIHSESGVAEYNAVFTTNFETEGLGIWTVSHYEPGKAIQFVVTHPGSHVKKLDISLEPAEEGCQLTWRHAYTAISSDGEAFVNLLDDSRYKTEMKYLESCLTHYCDTGKMLKHGPGIAEMIRHHLKRK